MARKSDLDVVLTAAQEVSAGHGPATSQRQSEPEDSIPALPDSKNKGQVGIKLNFASTPGRKVQTIK